MYASQSPDQFWENSLPGAALLYELGCLMVLFIYEAEKRDPGFTLNSAKALACL